MEEKDKNIKKSFWFTVVILQTVGILLIILWAITQKVEVDKQKTLALEAQRMAVESAHKAEQAREETLKYQQLYEQSLKQKK
jgi:hypothetical protein